MSEPYRSHSGASGGSGGGRGYAGNSSRGATQHNYLRSRTPSFNDGDDATYFDGGTGVSTRQSIRGTEELFYDRPSPAPHDPSRRGSMGPISTSTVSRTQSQASAGGYFAVTPGGQYSPAFSNTSYDTAPSSAPYPTTPGSGYNGSQHQPYNPAAYQAQPQRHATSAGFGVSAEYQPQRHATTAGASNYNSGQFSPTTATYNPSTFNTASYPTGTYRTGAVPQTAPLQPHSSQPFGGGSGYSQYATRPQYATASTLYGSGQPYSPEHIPTSTSTPPPHPPGSPGFAPGSYGQSPFGSTAYQPSSLSHQTSLSQGNKSYLTRPETHYNSGSDSDISGPDQVGHPLPSPPKDRPEPLQNVRYGLAGMNPLPSPPPPTPPSHGAFRQGHGVEDSQYPQARPLPHAPHGLHDKGRQREEEEAAEELYADVEASLAVMENKPQQAPGRRQSPHVPINDRSGDGPAPLFGGAGRVPHPQNGSGPTNGHLMAAQTQYYSGESDAEAAEGLAMIRLAEAQEERERRAVENPSTQTPPVRTAEEAESDSDFAPGVDMSMYGGFPGMSGFYGPDSYGGNNDIPVLPSHRSVPPPQSARGNDMGRTSSAAGSSSTAPRPQEYAIPDDMDVHPFPQFQNARVDTWGTGGLAEPSSQRRPMSFDEGDEDVDRSGSQSPSKLQNDSDDDLPELFYHPPAGSAYNSPITTRPLPSPPYNDFGAAGSLPYPDDTPPHQYQPSIAGRAQTMRPYATPTSPEVIGPTMPVLGPGPQFPRSTSLSSHTSTPPTIPPIRSKTDGKAHPARGHRQSALPTGAQTLAVNSEEVTPNDLYSTIPLIKKFDPKKLSSRDFKKCPTPWALSAIQAWLKEMTEGEQDLKQPAVEEGIVALFTHYVPTMNVADAEALAVRVVSGMIKERALVIDEEWVKFGDGEVSGVIFQVTGNGCYAPKLHEIECPGRCYAHHCARTLRKITLSQHPDELDKKKEDWATFWKIKKEDIAEISKKEIERQNNLHEIVQTEDEYMEHMRVLKVLYRDPIANTQPPIIKPTRLDSFVKDVFGKADAVRKVSEEHLLPQLKFRQREQGPWILGFSDIFREWIRKAKTAYLEYAAAFPKADMLVRREAERNLLFRQFLEQCRQDPRSRRLDWVTFLKAPITRLQRYSLLLFTVLKHTVIEGEEKEILQKAIEEIKAVTLECDTRVDEMSKRVALWELDTRLMMRQWDVDLRLDEKGRELIFQGDLQRNGNNRFTWLETHAILFDHYLVLAKTTMQKDAHGGAKHGRYDVSRMPIPMDLLVLESTNDEPVVRSTANRLGIGGPTAAKDKNDQKSGRHNTVGPGPGPGTLPHSNTGLSTTSTNTAPGRLVTALPDRSASDDRVMYPFRIKHLGNRSKADDNTYILYAPSQQNRKDWCDKIIQAKERHAQSLHAQNAEPFRLKVMADTAFGYEATAQSGPKPIIVRGTPLDRAIGEVEKMYEKAPGPRPNVICRASVNCATAFTVNYEREMIAIGTDSGVFTADAKNPRGWQRSINLTKVTQIAVLEDFSLFLVLSDKSLIAYHLDVIIPPPGNSPDAAIKQRPPQKLSGGKDVGFFATGRMKERSLVFYKKREGLSSTFKVLEPVFQKAPEKKSRFSRKGTTGFFQEFDEFYIPTDCYGINLFHSSLAIQTSKGFEVMTLDKKVPWSVPELKASHVTLIASRLQGQKPLGMFRLSDIEFLLCYEECAVYVNKHGDISRSVIMEFVGKAKSIAIYGPYILIFDNDFVEIRNADNGRLRQVIASRDCRCIDDAQCGGSAGTRSIKVAMAHPEVEGRQLVVELLVNEGQED
ncbi:CNH domain-domain-containing protein [Tuber borchii]|uniref:CNH domain-domain-containing protein n=1 Tax=Tuber borchii TaxID=42251 RepID=A0A2T6ZTU2_TUBBO|nr:CNH domain-domain-containing protein [Tuber borchii]